MFNIWVVREFLCLWCFHQRITLFNLHSIFDFLCFKNTVNHFEVDHTHNAISINDFLFVDLEIGLVLITVILEMLHRHINLTNYDLVLSKFIHVPDDKNQSLCSKQVYSIDRSVDVRDKLLLPCQLLNLLIVSKPHPVSAFTGARKLINKVGVEANLDVHVDSRDLLHPSHILDLLVDGGSDLAHDAWRKLQVAKSDELDGDFAVLLSWLCEVQIDVPRLRIGSDVLDLLEKLKVFLLVLLLGFRIVLLLVHNLSLLFEESLFQVSFSLTSLRLRNNQREQNGPMIRAQHTFLAIVI